MRKMEEENRKTIFCNVLISKALNDRIEKAIKKLQAKSYGVIYRADIIRNALERECKRIEKEVDA